MYLLFIKLYFEMVNGVTAGFFFEKVKFRYIQFKYDKNCNLFKKTVM